MSKTQEQVCFAGAVVTPIEFQNALKARAQAKLKAAPARPLTDDEVRARIEFLKADNARMRAAAAQRTIVDTARMQADREKRAKESAEQLMRQLIEQESPSQGRCNRGEKCAIAPDAPATWHTWATCFNHRR